MWMLIIFLYFLIYISRSQKYDFAGIKFRKLPKKMRNRESFFRQSIIYCIWNLGDNSKLKDPSLAGRQLPLKIWAPKTVTKRTEDKKRVKSPIFVPFFVGKLSQFRDLKFSWKSKILTKISLTPESLYFQSRFESIHGF